MRGVTHESTNLLGGFRETDLDERAEMIVEVAPHIQTLCCGLDMTLVDSASILQ